ncbi:hypothetical protein AB6F55_20210 [Providencia hangzhouensis]
MAITTHLAALPIQSMAQESVSGACNVRAAPPAKWTPGLHAQSKMGRFG